MFLNFDSICDTLRLQRSKINTTITNEVAELKNTIEPVIYNFKQLTTIKSTKFESAKQKINSDYNSTSPNSLPSSNLNTFSNINMNSNYNFSSNLKNSNSNQFQIVYQFLTQILIIKINIAMIVAKIKILFSLKII